MSLKKNTLWGIAGGVAPALSAVSSIPTLILYLGYEQFAIASLLLSLTIFFYVYDFGIGRALTYFIPQNNDNHSINQLLISSLYLTTIVGFILTTLIYLLAPIFVSGWMNVSDHLVEPSSNAFQLLALGIFPSILANVFRGALEGMSDFKKANIGKIFSGASIFLAPTLLVVVGKADLESISKMIVLTRYFALLFFVLLVAQRIQLSFISLKFTQIGKIIRYTQWAAIAGFISTMFVYGDRFIVSRYLDSESLAIYIFSQDILIRFLLIPWAMSIVLMPYLVSENLSKQDFTKFYEQQQSKIRNFSLLFVILTALGLYALNTVSSSYIELPTFLFEIVIIQTIGVFFCSLSQLPLIYLYSKGKPRVISLIYIIEALLYVLCAPFIFKSYGVVGACLVWMARLVLEFLFLTLYTKNMMKYANK